MEISGDVDSMWSRTTNCIKEAIRKVLGVSKDTFGGHRGDWYLN